MYFIGVTTGQSSITRLFPEWVTILGLGDAELVGVDLPIHADRDRYRDTVTQIKDDPLSLGALVTTHKVDLLEATRDLFDDEILRGLELWRGKCRRGGDRRGCDGSGNQRGGEPGHRTAAQ